MNKKVKNVSSRSKRQNLTGIMSILFHIFGVDRFLMKQNNEGFSQLIKTILLSFLSLFLCVYSRLFYIQKVENEWVPLNRGISENVLLVLIYFAVIVCLVMILINFIKGIINGIKIIKMDSNLFEKEISYNSKPNPEILRYRNNKVSYNLSLTAIAIQCLSFVAIYSALTFTSKFMTGLDIVINIVFLLVTFLIAEKVKTYNIKWGIASIVIAFVNIIRVPLYLYNPNSGEDLFLTTNIAQYRFVAAVICYFIVLLLLVISGIIAIIRGIKLNNFLKNHNKEVK